MRSFKYIFIFLLPVLCNAQSADGTFKTVTASGTNNYTISEVLKSPDAYDSKEKWIVTFTNGNTGAVTINRNGLGVKSLKKLDGTDFSSGDIPAGGRLEISYNGTYYQAIGVGGVPASRQITINGNTQSLASDPSWTITPIFGSQLGNLVYASPNGSSGDPSFRSLLVADISNFGSGWSSALTSIYSASAAGGLNGQILFNSSGSQAGSTGLTWDDTNKTIDIFTPLSGTNLFSQRWSDNSGNVLMSFGFIGATSLSPALKIIGQTRSNDVELALVQTNTVPRDYGMYFLCEKTTSDFSIWVRKNNVDQKTFTIYNTDGTFNFNNSGNIGGSLGITNALTVGTTLSVTSTSAFTGNMSFTKNASGTSLFQLTNNNASGATQISFQNDGSNASIAAYSSGIASYKILSGGDFHIFKPTSGDINILNDASSGKIQLAAGGSSTANLIVQTSGNIVQQSETISLTSIATAAGTTVLTSSSNGTQVFTGTTTQTVTLPVVTTLTNGFKFRIVNLSSGVVTVQTSGANSIKALAANSYLDLWVKDTTAGTGTASWNWYYNASLNN